MNGIWLPICAITISLFLLIIFFNKNNYNNKEVKIYMWMIIVNFLFSINAAICYMVSQKINIDAVTGFFQKFHLSYLLIIMALLFLYNFVINNFDEKANEKVKRGLIVYNIISMALIFIMPIDVITSNEVLDVGGIAYYVSMIGVVLFFILIVTLNIRYFILNKYNIRKNIPFIILTILIVLGLWLRIYYPEVITETYISAFVLLVMYHTIENPDMKMINELNIAKNQAVKANDAKMDFLYNMYHDIRTPLNTIVGFSESLKEENLSPQSTEEVKNIIEASDSLLDIVNGILDLSNLESDRIEIINSNYNFEKIFNELVAVSKSRLREDRPIEFKYKMDASIPDLLFGDYDRIKQIIFNLLTNAIKFTEKGYIDFRVNSICNNNICRLIISVEDSGIGIEKESMNKLFNKFERLEEKNSSVEGTGLGLAITKKIVEMMNGRIIVQSIYGKGSKFTIVLDQKIIAVNSPESTVSVDEKPMINYNLDNKKILIVDDNKLNLKVAARLLRNYNCQIEEADSGFKTLDLIAAGNNYDLIFMDDMMPKLSGTETLHKLQESVSFHIPVVALTANAISGMREKYLSEGFNDYLAKPIEKDELAMIIKKYLDR